MNDLIHEIRLWWATKLLSWALESIPDGHPSERGVIATLDVLSKG